MVLAKIADVVDELIGNKIVCN